MHASICMQTTCMCTCVSGHTSACMSVHMCACRYTHEFPKHTCIRDCGVHIHTHLCTGAQCVCLCGHAYIQIRGKTVQHSSRGSFMSPPRDLALSHSCLPGGLSGPLSGWAQVVRCRHMSSGSGPSCSKMLFPRLCRFPVT